MLTSQPASEFSTLPEAELFERPPDRWAGSLRSRWHLPERLPKPLEPDAREQLLRAGLRARCPQSATALLAFLLSTGCRIAEALALDRTDLRRDRVTVRGKGDRERVVLSPSAPAPRCAPRTNAHEGTQRFGVGEEFVPQQPE